MKLGAIQFDGPNEAILVLPYKGQTLVFKARAVLDYTKFDALCPVPKPKMVQKPGQKAKPADKDASYIAALEQWGEKRTSWTIIQSLKATPDLQWETVDEEKPETWNNYLQELKAAYFTPTDINRIVGLVFEANSVDENKLVEARERFLAGQEADNES